MAKLSDNLKALEKSFADIIVDEFTEDKFLSLNVVSVNVVFSGKMDGGIKKGTINTIAAPSAEGKSLIGLNALRSAQRDGMTCIVIDSERAFSMSTARSLGIDTKNIKVIRAVSIAEIKEVYATINKGLKAKERAEIFFLFDSWGPIIYTGQIDKAEKGSDTADMGRSAQFKNELANVINAFGNTTFCVNHVFDSMAMYGEKFCIPGGKRLFYLSDGIGLAVSEAQWKTDDGEYIGKIVTMGIKKGRSAKERCRVKFLLRANGALDPFYGLLDDAIECGVVEKVRGGYTRPEYDAGLVWKEEDLYCAKFWASLYRDNQFKDYIENKYTFVNDEMLSAKIDVLDIINGDKNYEDEELSEDDLYEEVEGSQIIDTPEEVEPIE